MTVHLVPDRTGHDPVDPHDAMAEIVELRRIRPVTGDRLRFGPYTCQRCDATNITGLEEIMIHAERCPK